MACVDHNILQTRIYIVTQVRINPLSIRLRHPRQQARQTHQVEWGLHTKEANREDWFATACFGSCTLLSAFPLSDFSLGKPTADEQAL